MTKESKNKINLDFKVTDELDRYNNYKAEPLVRFVLKHMDFLPYICDALTKFYSFDSINELGRRNKNKFKVFVQTIDFEKEDNYKYINEFEELLRQTYNIKSDYPSLENEMIQKKLSKVRGRILEKIIESFVQPRYLCTRSNPYMNKFSTGCMVLLNNKQLIINDRLTVDIAAWNGLRGEFYETKVGPHKFDESVLNLLSLIKNEMDNHNITSVVGCVTMANKDKLLENMEEVKSKTNINFNNCIKVFGKHELITLTENPFELLA